MLTTGLCLLSTFWSLTASFSRAGASSEQSLACHVKAFSLFFMGTSSQSGDSWTIQKLVTPLKHTDEIGNWLEGLLLPHDESDFLVLFVAHEFAVASASFLPLIIPHSVQFAPHLENALLTLFACHFLDLREGDLSV